MKNVLEYLKLYDGGIFMDMNYDCSFETSKEITEEGLLNLIRETFDADVNGLKVENIDSFQDENGENFVITCSKDEGELHTLKVFHAYGEK